MKKLFFLITLASAVGCSEKVDPSFNCLLSSQAWPGSGSVAFEYDNKGVLVSRTSSDLIAHRTETETYTYDVNGRLTQSDVTLVLGSLHSSTTYKFVYSSDEKTVKRVEFYNGVEQGTSTYTMTSNTATESYTRAGNSVVIYSNEFTFVGENIVTEVYKEFLGPNNALSNTEITERSNFDSGISSLYTFFSRVKGLPYPTSKNNPGKATITTVNVVNGISQPATILSYTYTYTYNKSNAVLTKNYALAAGGTASGVSETNSYQGCD